MRHAVQLQVVHHNRLFRECLVAVLADVARFQVEEVDHTGPAYWSQIAQRPPDVLLVGSNLPDDPARIIRRARQDFRDAKILLLASPGRENVLECISAGAHGCVLEQCSVAELLAAIDQILAGQAFCSPELVRIMFERLARAPHAACWSAGAKSSGLTPRELEIVHLIASRLSNKEIARNLSVSLCTVKNHVHNIIEKLQVGDRHEAVEYAQRHNLLDGAGRLRAAANLN